MTSFEASLSDAFASYQRGDLARAEQIGRELIAVRPSDSGLTGMLGMIALNRQAYAEAIPLLRTALAGSPDTVPLRISLGFALANAGELDEARRVAGGTSIPQLERIVAYADQTQGRIDDAIARYRRVLDGFPEDAESWKNIGLLLLHKNEIGEAAAAFEASLDIRFDPSVVAHLADAMARGERHPDRQKLLRGAIAKDPQNVALLVELGLAEGAMGEFDQAERAYRSAIAAAPSQPRAYLEYGMMLESLNRIDELQRLVADARVAGAGHDGSQVDFLEASLMRRTGRFAEALELAERASEGVNPSRRAQLIGESADRLGDTGKAFAAFAEMNRLQGAGPAADFARSRDFPGEVARTIQLLDSGEASLQTQGGDAGPAPIFLVGFPRSGTTLLDTLLMNLPGTDMLEEEPLIERLETEIGGTAGLSNLSEERRQALIADYWRMVGERKPGRDPDSRLIDKFPLHLVRAPVIHALFPEARFIMVERHPCDVVLSCFMARFQINRATVHFHKIEDAARLYDLAMQAWHKAREVLSLDVHTARYEDMIADPAAALKPVVSFVGAEWDDAILDHQASAAKRGHIPTASYAQVAEPLYDRAVGRWTRYRAQLAPVLPLLEPWAAKMGYDI